MSTQPGDAADASAKDWSEFYQLRRQYIDEILFGCRMTAVEKLVGIAIAYSTNRNTRTTFESYSTFAKRLGIKMKAVQTAAENLQFDNRLKIERLHGRLYLTPLVKGDAPHRSTKGATKFYEKRGALCEAILKCPLTPAERIAYLGIAALTDQDNGECNQGNAYIARLIGISRKTMTRAICSLIYCDVLTAKATDGREDTLAVQDPRTKFKSANPGHGSGHHPGHHPGHAQPVYRDKSDGCASTFKTSMSSESIPSTTYSVTDAASRVKTVKFASETAWLAFHELYGLIVDHSHDTNRMTVAGIIALLNSEMTGYGEYATEWYLFECIRFGLFKRDDQHVELTELAHDTYILGYEEPAAAEKKVA
jgi:hypothetical protein